MATRRDKLTISTVLRSSKLLAAALLTAILFSGIATTPALADAPAEGIVVEGESVPGIALGSTRAAVEAAYGQPTRCQDIEIDGDLAYCSFPVEGGGGVSVRYQGADGRHATNSPEDVVYDIGWSQSVTGWTTTAGINTEIALADREAVAAAYPNADVTYEDGKITRVEDSTLGILIRWVPSGYIFPDSVLMSIYTPPALLPEGSNLHVSDINLTVDKYRSRRHLVAVIAVHGEQGQPVAGASVIVTWTYPRGTVWTVEEVTSNTGNAFFEIYDAHPGVWRLTVEDVLLDGHPLDSVNSVMSAEIRVK